MRPFEVRQRILGIEERFDGDDEFLVISNTIPAELALEGAGLPGVAASPESPADALPDSLSAPPKAIPGETVEGEVVEDSDEDAAIEKFHVRKQARMSARERGLVRTFRPDLEGFILEFAKQTADAIREKDPDGKLTEAQVEQVLPDPDDMEEALLELSRPSLEANFEAGFEEGQVDIEEELERKTAKSEVKKQFEIADDLFEEALAEFITARQIAYAPPIVETLVSNMRQSLIEGVLGGERNRELVDRVQETLVDQSRDRATKIAATEVRGGLNRGSLESYRASQVVAQKQWLTARDSRVRGARPSDRFTHRVVDRQIVGINDAFNVDGESLQHPLDSAGSPGNIIRCRCSMRPVVAVAGQ
jgi:hypothetical protein